MTKEQEKQIPVVSILGHVDHGKTTLLDHIRQSRVQAKEAGGITQKISAFTIPLKKETGKEESKGKNEAEGKLVTFIDTPGHEAFNLMRLRGGSVADIVLLIVAADDGVKPQTVESIDIIKESSVKPIVVITKVDLGKENVAKIKRDIANRGILVEGMGGNIPVVEVSGTTGEGVSELLDMIDLVIEVEGMKESEKLPSDVLGKAFALETVKDKFRGNVVTLIVKEGQFKQGKWFTYSLGNKVYFEKIKAFFTEEDKNIEELNKGFGGRVIGISSPVELGAEVFCFEQKNETLAKELLLKKEEREEEKEKKKSKKEEEQSEEVDEAEILESFFDDEQDDEEEKEFKVLVKSSSEGSLEAIKKSIEKIKVEGVKVKIIDSGIGNIGIKDVELASVTKSIILGFEVAFEKGAQELAKKNRVFTKSYDIIYKLTDEIEEAVKALVEPEELEEEIGNAEIKQVFELSDGTQVIGCKGTEGSVKKGAKAYIVRDDDIIGEGKIVSMKHGKNDIKEGTKGNEFGVVLAQAVPNIEEGDSLYCFTILK